MRIEFVPEAATELETYQAQYELERAGLGAEFLTEVEGTLARLVEGPLHVQKISRTPFRRAHIARFPFSLVFRVIDDRIRIIAVAPQKKKPRYWRKRS